MSRFLVFKNRFGTPATFKPASGRITHPQVIRISTKTFNFEADLDSVLITAIDKFLKKNRISPLSLKTIEIAGDIDKNSFAHKMALSFVKAAYLAGLKKSRNKANYPSLIDRQGTKLSGYLRVDN